MVFIKKIFYSKALSKIKIFLSAILVALAFLSVYLINPFQTGKVTETITDRVSETTMTSVIPETTSTEKTTSTMLIEGSTTTVSSVDTRDGGNGGSETTSTISTTQKTTTTEKTSTSEESETSDCEDLGCLSGTKFVGSKGSDKYHYCDCRWAKRIKSENLVCFRSVEEAQERGYKPCGTCNPPQPPGTTTTISETTTTVETSTTIETGDACVSLGCPSGTQFVGSKKSDKYHYCDCRWAKKINEENLRCFQSVDEAKSMGYKPCGTCKPPE